MEDKKKTVNATQVEEKIKAAVYGQDSANDSVLDKVWVAKAGLNKSDKSGCVCYMSQLAQAKQN